MRGSEDIGLWVILPLGIGVGILVLVVEGFLALAQFVFRYMPTLHIALV